MPPTPFLIRHLTDVEREQYRDMRWRLDHADEPVLVLRTLSDLLLLARHAEHLAVVEARGRGISWTKIAEALRRSRQSVHRQYASDPGVLHAEAELAATPEAPQ